MGWTVGSGRRRVSQMESRFGFGMCPGIVNAKKQDF